MQDEKKDAASFYRYFSKLPKIKTLIRLYDRGSCYCAYGNDADVVSTAQGRAGENLPTLDCDKGRTLKRITIGTGALLPLLQSIIFEMRLSVEILVQDKKLKSWVTDKRATPGNIQAFEDVLSPPSSGAVSAAISVTPDFSVSIAHVDATNRDIGTTQFADGHQLATLAALLTRLSVSEAFISSTESPEHQRLGHVLQLSDVVIRRVDPALFTTKLADSALEVVTRLTGTPHPFLTAPHMIMPLVRNMALDQWDDATAHIVPVPLEGIMALDAAVCRALDLLPSAQKGPEPGSLFALLKAHTSGPDGRYTLANWIRQPLVDSEIINKRLDVVEELASRVDLLDMICGSIKKVSALGTIANRMGRRTTTLKDTVKLYQSLQHCQAVCDVITDAGLVNLSDMFKSTLEQSLDQANNLEALIEKTVDFKALSRHEYQLNPAFDTTLSQLEKDQRRLYGKMEGVGRSVAGEIGVKSEKVKLEFKAGLGYHLRISRTDEKKLRSSDVSGVTVLEARSTGVRFETNRLRRSSQEYASVSAKYSKAQKALLAKVMGVIHEYHSTVKTLASTIGQLDVLAAFATYSIRTATTRPVLVADDRVLDLTDGRHPLLDAMPDLDYVPSTARLTGSRLAVITGCNMGGKSTFLRMSGMLTVMAQIGCPVPAAQFTLSPRSRLFVRVGASDNLVKGLSTFMAEMVDLATILEGANRDALILIDELGRGTSTSDGYGLCRSVSEHLVTADIGQTLFVTHFHDLCTLERDMPDRVVNLKAESRLTESGLVLLHRIVPGQASNSLGIHVAKLARWPDRVIAMAEETLDRTKLADSSAVEQKMAKLEDRAALEVIRSGDIDQMRKILEI
ncbi:DNA mismatch repair protein MSH2 [Carpediemonas membranifera]|uniref:DNA mismatch repair protein MSH2 n=1 Tax=Carpediemonas membranifera TaxID=201153 RepID=A0A8J6E584_9EUKA|nr:DNA mismatch repair protein MSH2 [Carpediemonas membranifera]|eukprot:KAG9395422.1 DNA mismatch repair protein MSH2 [Carpediemonas membranifera]